MRLGNARAPRQLPQPRKEQKRGGPTGGDGRPKAANQMELIRHAASRMQKTHK